MQYFTLLNLHIENPYLSQGNTYLSQGDVSFKLEMLWRFSISYALRDIIITTTLLKINQ